MVGVPAVARALEVQGFITKNCQRHLGVVIYASDSTVETMDLDGKYQAIPIDDIETVYVFNIIENPIARFSVDQNALERLKAIYVEDSPDARTLAFPVRFIEDLIIFYSLEGKSHVHRLADIYKLRPAPASALGEHRPASAKNPGFEFADQSGHCPQPSSLNAKAIKPTRVLADKISIAEFFGGFAQGYESLNSFQERTYLYAKPLVFDPYTRLGLTFGGEREEPGLPLPLYFQWSTGEPYRFQSFNVVGFKAQEVLPNTEPIFAIRSDVKSHAFHAVFVGNVAGLPAGNSIFVGGGDLFKMKQDVTVQPSFNYLAMMGADFGPYSLSAGLYYPTYGVQVRDETREILGSTSAYAVRGMYTSRDFRVRVIGSLSKYSSGQATEDDVSGRTANNETVTVNTYSFDAHYLRGGVDYDFSRKLRLSVDGIYVGGNYKETATYASAPGVPKPSDIKFRKFTTQVQVRQSFGKYIALTGAANFIQNNYNSNFVSIGKDREQRETKFFGSLEFIF